MSATVKVLELFTYPVKSCRPIALHQAKLGLQGFAFDRQWMVVKENGRALTQRETPLLSQIQVFITDGMLELARTGHGSIQLPLLPDVLSQQEGEIQAIKLWGDACDTVEVSSEASRWLTQALESSAAINLVRMAPGFIRPQSDPEHLGEHTRVQFADTAPYLVIDESSLQKLNEVLIGKGESAVPMNRFRPNIVIRGLTAFSEHQQHSLRNDRFCLQFRMPCTRCVVPTIDQDTSRRHEFMEPFTTLLDINPLNLKRRQPLFGQYATLENGAGELISLGDRLHCCDYV
jgi:uncharacterized protein